MDTANINYNDCLANFYQLLSRCIDDEVSDIHINSSRPVFIRVHNQLVRCEQYFFTSEQIKTVTQKILPESKWVKLANERVLDTSLCYQGRRFRLNIYRSLEGYNLACRLIRKQAFKLEKYQTFATLAKWVTSAKGLIIISGGTGTGKSSTLAAMLEYLNIHNSKHIITLEDPVEYVFTEQQCLINQREYLSDFNEFSEAIKMAMREDPDVIMVGEIRDAVTMKATLEAAETGHLVLATLHAGSVEEVVSRVESFFDFTEAEIIRQQLANVLLGIAAQQLVSVQEGMRCAMEILVANVPIRNILRHGHLEQLNSQLELNRNIGMQSMHLARQQLGVKEVGSDG